ncbi:AmmeMemoRadiSam system radical SAM enzyme [Collinsella tanakaei]|uniref:AmmeMemoRadiSam system radical SAM enzyme n=1 Tax=Collinsella tanakaei TaxID=626935 RepID=UPI0025A3FE21|nr:AmmeMemoRadiSam system radical SAM enzyme [Collinsella tanakaei]MDM8300784.1 AmmeMemoRadiSam system radical SAM enzyme [Collinsella tanakaei]
MSTTCTACPRRGRLAPGQLGFCRARRAGDGVITAENYGRVTSLALDPIEKKPLARFMPGAFVVSVGSYGCNLRCPFCQNADISQAGADNVPWREISPQELVDLTLDARSHDPRVAGIAYTYNEPLIGWEYVRDCARLAHEHGLVNVLVSNGCAEARVIDELAGLIDAANIDLKGFTDAFYDACGGAPGSLACVKGTIARLAADPTCHLEVTTLVVPDMNDTDDEIDAAARWLASLDGGRGRGTITYHVTRFFPRWRLIDREPTPVESVYHLADVARRHLEHVFTGNC